MAAARPLVSFVFSRADLTIELDQNLMNRLDGRELDSFIGQHHGADQDGVSLQRSACDKVCHFHGPIAHLPAKPLRHAADPVVAGLGCCYRLAERRIRTGRVDVCLDEPDHIAWGRFRP